jgi:putative FmdB family regulatory protein
VPIYEYLCESCGKLTEVVQKISDPPPKKCAECGSRKLARLVSRSAFQLKGGGWYSDLYSTPKKKAASGEAAGGKGGESPAPSSPAPKESAPSPKKTGEKG